MELKIAISPCPNDTFIFENIYNKKVNIEGIEFDFTFLDIEELNQAALNEKYDIIKISCAHYHFVSNHYHLIKSGGAMGKGVGPILVSKQKSIQDIQSVAIPGKHTTANYLLTNLFPQINNKSEVLFSEIEDAIIHEKFDAGLLIHEGRFTYESKGLKLIADLGQLWEQKTRLPIPLGCIIMHKKHPEYLIHEVEKIIRYSISNYDDKGNAIISDFIKSHAQEMDLGTMRKHIDLYVNEYSRDMGEEGVELIKGLYA